MTNKEEIFEEEFEVEDPKQVTYDSPTPIQEDVAVEGNANEEEKKFSELSNYEKIKMASLQHGVVVKPPNPSCKHCYGRGYISTITLTAPVEPTSGGDTSAVELITEELPNPCKCIYRKEDRHKMFTGNISLGSKQARKYESRKFKKEKKEIHTSGTNIEKQRLEAKKRKAKKSKRKQNKRKKR